MNGNEYCNCNVHGAEQNTSTCAPVEIELILFVLFIWARDGCYTIVYWLFEKAELG